MNINDNDRNKVKINYDPYKKKIKYEIWNPEREDWDKPADTSNFSQSRFTDNTTIQDKILDILDTLNNTYYSGTEGVDVYFEGTDDDFNDIKSVIEHQEFKIGFRKGNLYLDPARTVIGQIKKHYSKIEELLTKYPDKDIKKEVSRYQETVKPNVSICVMGLYSSGKSAFINALIGREILSSSGDPLTAKNYKITLGNEYKIRFECDEKEFVLAFEDNKYTSSQTGEFPIIKELHTVLKENAQAEKRMYKALQFINNNVEKYSFSDLIEVTVIPYHSTLPVNEYEFVIYDTPGSDSASYEEHIKVLKKSLEEQTNGLPIFVTDSESTDKEGNKKLIETIENLGSALDIANTIVVINKSDKIAKDAYKSIQEKAGRQAVSKLNASRICFVSSIAGLGSKKDSGCWEDKQYQETYDLSVIPTLAKPDSNYYREPYLYNKMPDDGYSESIKNMGNAKEERMLMFINSGLHCVESEITRFAQKYALYNKCVQAGEYLAKAMDVAITKMDSIKKDQKGASDRLRRKLDAEKADLVERLKKECDNAFEIYSTKYIDKMTDLLVRHQDFSEIESELEKSCQNIKNTRKEVREAETDRLISPLYNEKMNQYIINSWDLSNRFWEEACSQFKEECLKVALGSNALTDEQKQILENYVKMNISKMTPYKETISTSEIGAYRTVRVLFLKIKKFSVTECVNGFKEKVKNTLTASNQRVLGNNRELFKSWSKQFEYDLESQLADMNPNLCELGQEIRLCAEELKQLEDQRSLLDKHQKAIGMLMCFKERNSNG